MKRSSFSESYPNPSQLLPESFPNPSRIFPLWTLPVARVPIALLKPTTAGGIITSLPCRLASRILPASFPTPSQPFSESSPDLLCAHPSCRQQHDRSEADPSRANQLLDMWMSFPNPSRLLLKPFPDPSQVLPISPLCNASLRSAVPIGRCRPLPMGLIVPFVPSFPGSFPNHFPTDCDCLRPLSRWWSPQKVQANRRTLLRSLSNPSQIPPLEILTAARGPIGLKPIPAEKSIVRFAVSLPMSLLNPSQILPAAPSWVGLKQTPAREMNVRIVDTLPEFFPGLPFVNPWCRSGPDRPEAGE